MLWDETVSLGAPWLKRKQLQCRFEAAQLKLLAVYKVEIRQNGQSMSEYVRVCQSMSEYVRVQLTAKTSQTHHGSLLPLQTRCHDVLPALNLKALGGAGASGGALPGWLKT